MRLAARCMATMAFAFVLAPALCADDTTQPKAKTKKDEAPASVIALSAVTKGQPAPASTSPTSAADAYVQPAAAMHSWDESENSFPKVEWFFGYSFWRAMPTSASNRMGYLHGGSTSIAYNFNRYVGLVADFAGFDNSKLTLLGPTGSETVDSDGSAYTFMFGPRFSYRRHERFTPYFQALFGGAHASSVTISGCSGDPSCTPLGSETTFATMIGTGFDIKLSRHIALRLFEGDFLLTHFKDPFSASGDQGWQKNARFSTGIVFRFGGNPPPPPSAPIGATCSADREFVYLGSGDVVVVSAQATNAGNSPLSYSWSASEGSVDGTGPQVRWNSSDRRLGTYTVRVRVDSGRSGAADCSVSIRVKRRPNRPPVMSCSANHPVVTVGDSVEITAVASDPDDDPLTYSWNASAGRVEGSGSSVTFQTAALSPGSYTVTGHVDDGRTGTADCAVNVEVQAPQPPPEVKELETRLSLHSIYFPTARPTMANPGGGLVESQRKVLLSLAADFNRYLTFKPQARLILEGHADRRGPVEYNKELTERRVERAKSFLVEQGVPDANIETRALGKEENLDAAQVKQLVDQNPDLTNDERQRIEANLDVIVLANNRRVDVSLNTTGQQSVRQYPFNAKDSLTLLSTKGGKTEGPTKPPAKKKNTTP